MSGGTPDKKAKEWMLKRDIESGEQKTLEEDNDPTGELQEEFKN